MAKVVLVEANSQEELNKKVDKYLNKGYDLFMKQCIADGVYQQPVYKN